MTTMTVTKILTIYERIQKSSRLADMVDSEKLKSAYQTEVCTLWEALFIMLQRDENDTRCAVMDRVITLAKREEAKKAMFEGEEA